MASVESRPRVLIIGGLGYFGSRLTLDLQTDYTVVSTSRSLSATRRLWLKNECPSVEWAEFDSTKSAPLPAKAYFDYLINLATPGSQESAKNPEGSSRAALNTISACVELMKQKRAGRLIHFSSFHVYGSTPEPVYWEEGERKPTHPYGQVHLAVEKWLETHAQNLEISVLRPTNGVGAPAHSELGIQSRLLFLDCCRQAVEQGHIQLNSDGLAYRDFVPLPDFIRAVRQILTGTGKTLTFYNLASGSVCRLQELASKIQLHASQFLDRPISLSLGSQGDPFKSRFEIDIEKIKGLGWLPALALKEEINRTLSFFLKNKTGNAHKVNAATHNSTATLNNP